MTWGEWFRFVTKQVKSSEVEEVQGKRPPKRKYRQFLTPWMMKQIRTCRHEYEWAAKKVGVPWLALAPIHLRERGLKRTPYPGGNFQLDCGGHGTAERARRRDKYVATVMKKYDILYYGNINSDFGTQVLVAAHILKTKRRRVWNAERGWPEHVLSDSWFGYNGRSRYYNQFWQVGYGSKSRHRRWSPYPSNMMGGVRLKVKGSVDSKSGAKKIVTGRLDKNPGAVLIYRELKSRRTELARKIPA